MQEQQIPQKTTVEVFAVELRRHLVRILCARYGDKEMAEEVASAETLRFLQRPDRILANYPSAQVYASARAAHGRSDHLRRNRVQRCEGARLRTDTDGTYSTRIEVLSADAQWADDGGSSWSLIADPATISDDVHGDRLDAQRVASRALEALPAEGRQLAFDVIALGHTVTDIAKQRGVARETAQRALGRALDTMRREVAA